MVDAPRQPHWQPLPDIITVLADMPPAALISVQGLAEKLGRKPNAINACIDRGELPAPIPLSNKAYWTVGFLIAYMEHRLTEVWQRSREPMPKRRPDLVGVRQLHPNRRR